MKTSLETNEFLEAHIEDGAFPGAAYAFGSNTQTFIGAVGRTRYSDDAPLVNLSTMYDLASLTKVVATTTYAIKLFPDPDDLVNRIVQEHVPEFPRDDVTIGHLLRHDSGMPAYSWNLAGTMLDAKATDERLLHTTCDNEPGSKTTYSCLNFVLLMHWLQRSSGQGFEELAEQTCGHYRPSKKLPANTMYAPTETMEEWRPKLEQSKDLPSLDPKFVQGVVHDPVAFYQGGVSGNAGLFGNIRQLQTYADKWIYSPESYSPHWEKWVSRQSQESSRALGWDTKSPRGSSAGTLFGPRSFGHTGFTGTSIWIDPDARIYAVLLTNRVHPTANNSKITQVRPAFHDFAVKLLQS